jgi:di/tricarboxylate transporter
MAVTFFTNTACAAYAALGVRGVARNCLVVSLVAILLGIALAFSLGHDRASQWLFAGGVLTMVVPTVAMLASLVWLRPYGYRLLRKPARA